MLETPVETTWQIDGLCDRKMKTYFRLNWEREWLARGSMWEDISFYNLLISNKN